jgi:hypothetical protein
VWLKIAPVVNANAAIIVRVKDATVAAANKGL